MRLRLKTLISVSIILLILIAKLSPVSFAETITYTYDNLNRVTKVNYGNGAIITYTYDAAGNRLTMNAATPIVTPTPISPPTVTPTPSPVPTPGGSQTHYTFDEGSGTVAGDSSGNGNHGAINGATWTTGKSGGALSFDGNDYVQIPGSWDNPKISLSLPGHS